jgi:hypothetical protein
LRSFFDAIADAPAREPLEPIEGKRGPGVVSRQALAPDTLPIPALRERALGR